ncbi:MAG: HupE/UreJ family protein [Cyanobium sp.]
MKRFFFPITALAALAVVSLGALPSGAHGTAGGGAMAGLAHPLLGVDHLLMLLAVGTAASQLSLLLLPWAWGGGVIGALAGHGGFPAPLLETLATLAIMAVAALTLVWGQRGSANRSIPLFSGVVVGAGVAIHGLLHWMEAPADGSRLLWWAGALLSSVVLSGGTALLLRRVPQSWGRVVALTTLMAGGVLFLAF